MKSMTYEIPSITLYTYVMSPFAAKVHCFLHYKRLPFECFYINPLRVKHDLPVGLQIPVLSIGDESRADSSPIGLWLDEMFPDAPRLLPESGDEREQLLKIDDWISRCLIPASFRFFPGDGINAIRNGWKLSYVMTNTARGGLPMILRAIWPLLVRRVGFVKRLVEMADDGRSLPNAKRHLYRQFISHLNGGPFLAGRSVPSMPDLAAYPQFALYYCTGFHNGDDILEYPEIMEWLSRMRPYVSGDPPLIPEGVRRHDLP